jgi:hypothetical protein
MYSFMMQAGRMHTTIYSRYAVLLYKQEQGKCQFANINLTKNSTEKMLMRFKLVTSNL